MANTTKATQRSARGKPTARSARGKARFSKPVAEKPDVYTIMLIFAFLALTIGSLILYLELAAYHFEMIPVR